MAKTDTLALMNISRLQALEEYQALTDIQKKICYEHVTYPHFSKNDLADRLKVPRADVYYFFNSVGWEKVNQEIAKQQLRELIQLSIRTLRECMINPASSFSVRREAATSVLVNAHLLTSPRGTSISKTDNKMVVLWGNEAEEKLQNVTKDFNHSNGIKDTVLPAQEAAGSPRFEGPVQDSGSRAAVGQDHAGG